MIAATVYVRNLTKSLNYDLRGTAGAENKTCTFHRSADYPSIGLFCCQGPGEPFFPSGLGVYGRGFKAKGLRSSYPGLSD